MTSIEKSVLFIGGLVASICLIAILVVSSITMVEVSRNQASQSQAPVHYVLERRRAPTGEGYQEYLSPLPPEYPLPPRFPLGSKGDKEE